MLQLTCQLAKADGRFDYLDAMISEGKAGMEHAVWIDCPTNQSKIIKNQSQIDRKSIKNQPKIMNKFQVSFNCMSQV